MSPLEQDFPRRKTRRDRAEIFYGFDALPRARCCLTQPSHEIPGRPCGSAELHEDLRGKSIGRLRTFRRQESAGDPAVGLPAAEERAERLFIERDREVASDLRCGIGEEAQDFPALHRLLEFFSHVNVIALGKKGLLDPPFDLHDRETDSHLYRIRYLPDAHRECGILEGGFHLPPPEVSEVSAVVGYLGVLEHLPRQRAEPRTRLNPLLQAPLVVFRFRVEVPGPHLRLIPPE